MKGFKKFISVCTALTSACMLALVPAGNTLQVSADSPTTFYIKCNDGDWRMQVAGADDTGWRAEDAGRELYYLNEGDERVKDGDIVVILADDDGSAGSSEIRINARLSNLTVSHTNCVIYTGGIDDCYVLSDSFAAINGNVTNAYVYDNAISNFNNNVGNLRLISSEENSVNTDVYVVGTVGYASTANPGGVLTEYYNFKADCFHFAPHGGLMTDPANYSTSGSGPVSAPAATTSSNAPAASSSSSASGYDDVPKTGESNLIVWLFAISAICLTGHLVMRKSL
ncbi:MAG: hypothetical protein NC079_03305 [Clostridium sp.]|nr:hypothetical protein [Acetatifactor muris]MCM1525840.1 hypothetical protein [Bacteroides sp.]MCM1562620.1 hypothetical protein [Clostridium sp.]